ncbi:MAG: hypothetical protein AAF297_08375 [Planctomycetota bacterium]
MHEISYDRRSEHESWLREVTVLPTAAGHEDRVIGWVDRWLEGRSGIQKRVDAHGNVELSIGTPTDAPVYFTAHMDHPAFVVERVVAPSVLELAFRGGVMDAYFEDATVVVHLPGGARVRGTITGRGDQSEPFKSWMCELESDADVPAGALATWDFPEPSVERMDGGAGECDVFFTNACDDLAALVAALCALDELAQAGCTHDVRVLLTRAEEIGFIGAIGASRDGFMPKDSRIVALETSRSFPHDSPIGGGPIVRVGDRVSVFSPTLTGAVASVAERLAGKSAHPLAVEKDAKLNWRWQRKLMPGGACEASVFCSYGYESTCVCLPLGNYHNMADLTAVQAGTNETTPTVGREHVALSDFHGMVDLLVGCGEELPADGGFRDRVEKLWADRKFVLA